MFFESALNSLPSYGLSANTVQISLVFLVTFLGVSFLYSWLKNRPKNLPPGPTGVPILGYLPFLGAEPHKTMLKLGEKYGDIFGLYLGSKYTIILNEYNLVKETICHPAALDRASQVFDHLQVPGFIARNGDEWLEQRRFSLYSVKELGLGRGPWESLIMEEVASFVDTVQSHKGAPVDIHDSLGSSVSSNIISLLIGRRLNKGTEDDKIQLSVDFADVSFTYMAPSDPATVMPTLRKYLEMFKVAGYDRSKRIISSFCRFIKDEVDRHKTSPEFKDVPDFINSYLTKLSNLVSAPKSRHYFNETALIGNLNILFLGGSDTIMSSMGWLMRLMAEYQDIQDKVYHEIMDVLGKDGTARYEERHKIPFTFAVLMETQRYGSIVPLSTTRCANQDFVINGYTIPKGAEIVSNLWALHYDTKFWKNPEKFQPERFLINDGTTLVRMPPSYAPFSIGRRNCPGETIAWMEILAYFTEVVKRFHITTPPGVKPQFDIVNGLVAHLKPQPLCFSERTVDPNSHGER